VSATTYPGTATPLRGLNPFTESERDVFLGRESERDDLCKLVSSDGFRAGLVYGENGVGKTSLLRAGVVPYLRDHGVVALPCEDVFRPADAFARAAQEHTGQMAEPGEQSVHYLARIVSQAMEGQQYLFILDDVDLLLGSGNDELIHELGDLFARVVTRSAGRARFLFCCPSKQVHLFGILERRTGSLFPPSSRFQLHPFAPQVATTVLDRTFALAGLPAGADVAQRVVDDIAASAGGSVLPAHLQVAALAVGQLSVTTAADVQAIGGARELEDRWVESAADETGNQRAALRLLAELAHGEGTVPYAPDWAAARVGLDPSFADNALQAFARRGIVRPVAVVNRPDTHYVLAHDVLAGRMREITAPARAAARRAYELLGSKAAQGGRLSLGEWWAVRTEGIVPSTDEERAVLARTQLLGRIALGVLAAIPILVLVVAYLSKAGAFYLDAVPSADGRTERVVVKAGTPSSWFNWLPASPSFGSVVADPGLSRSRVPADVWTAIVDHDIAGDLDDGYRDAVSQATRPFERGLAQYAATGDDGRLVDLFPADLPPAEKAERLEALAPIATGKPQESAVIAQLLEEPSPIVQTAALDVAASAAARHDSAYTGVLAGALASDDAELRRVGLAAVRGLPRARATEIFEAALAADPPVEVRPALMAAASTDSGAEGASAAGAVTVLRSKKASKAAQRRARRLLQTAFERNATAATAEAASLAGDGDAPKANRLAAFELIAEFASDADTNAIKPTLRLGIQAKDEDVRAAALPLFARIEPRAEAEEEVVVYAETLAAGELSDTLRRAYALAWGELARRGSGAAEAAIRPLLGDDTTRVRAAAARAYGFNGRVAQGELSKLIETDRFEVAVGAAWGLANSADAGGSRSRAAGQVAKLWKKKGRARRVATEVFAAMAHRRPSSVINYLKAAIAQSDDTSLHPIAARGLCAAYEANSSTAARELARRAAGNPNPDVRRVVIECMARQEKPGGLEANVASDLATDPDSAIRSRAAEVLSAVALAGGKDAEDAAKVLLDLVADDQSQVRMMAVRGLATLGVRSPKRTERALRAAFDRRDADQVQKLEILSAARNVGAGSLVSLALADGSPAVRREAVGTAIDTRQQVASAVNAALADADATVRRAALERLAAGDSGLSAADLARALALAVRDEDPSIAATALETYARIGDQQEVVSRLRGELASQSERVRARAARAGLGLARRDGKVALELLGPLVDDPSHDVRAAALPALAAAKAALESPEAVATELRSHEDHATRRIVAAAALVAMARVDEKSAAATAVLGDVAESGPPLASLAAEVAQGLVRSGSDAAFFGLLLP